MREKQGTRGQEIAGTTNEWKGPQYRLEVDAMLLLFRRDANTLIGRLTATTEPSRCQRAVDTKFPERPVTITTTLLQHTYSRLVSGVNYK